MRPLALLAAAAALLAAPGVASAAEGEEAEDKRALLLTVEAGVGHVDLGGLSDSLGFDKTAANGGVYGGGAGMRFDRLRAGVRFRGAATTEFTLWSVLAEVGYGLKLKPLQPVFFLHGGWLWSTGIERAVFASALPELNVLPPDVRVHGPTIGAEAQALYFPVKQVGIGPFAGFDVMFLNRPQVGLPQSLVQISDDVKKNPLYTDSGSGTGWTIQLGIRGILDLGF